MFEKGDPYYNPNLSMDVSWMMNEDGYGTSCSVDGQHMMYIENRLLVTIFLRIVCSCVIIDKI